MLTTAILVPNHCGVSLRCNRDEFRMRHVKLPIIRQHQLERLERPRFNESFQRCEIHATTVLARVKVSISRLAPNRGHSFSSVPFRTIRFCLTEIAQRTSICSPTPLVNSSGMRARSRRGR